MSARARRLAPVLRLRDLVVVAAASIGPAFSLATTMGAMIAAASRWTWLALLAVTVLMAMIAAGYKRLGERIPDAGSSYAWVRAAFGPAAGAYAAWVLLVANVFAVLATALPAATYTLDLLAPARSGDPRGTAWVACGWIAAASLLLWYGLRPTALLAAVLLAAELVVLGGASAAAVVHPRAGAVAFAAAPLDATGFVAALLLGVWIVDGWEVSASAAEETDGPSSAPGAGGLAGLMLTGAVLLAGVAAFAEVGTAQGFAQHTDDALAYVGSLLGRGWGPVLSVTVLVSLAASLQTTLVYLTRSVYAMGRDGLLPRALGELDRRAEPAVAIVAIGAVSLAFALASGFSASARDGFGLALRGTSWFLGVLFVLSAGAAVRTFARDPARRWSGAVLPGTGAAILAAVLLLSLRGDDLSTRGFIVTAAIIGLPLAAWRGRSARRAV
ncbi:MAG TPA: APC family permease [Candidatus Baltobacteraceae bacterium]|nr:APC family permease [Candidatus Baltobacteraceae bacterium]